MHEKTTEVASTEIADLELVDKAYEDLSQIFSNHLENAMQEAGKYLIKEFYDDNIELAREKKSPKDESLNQLIKRLQNRSAASPSKSWIYQSIGLVIQEHDMEEEKDIFQTFGKIYLSHKLSLLPITDMDKKKELISAIVDEGLSVRDLEERKKKHQTISERKNSLISLLNDPEKIVGDSAKDILNLDALKKEPLNKLNKYKEKTTAKCEELKLRLEELQEEIKKHKLYVKKYEELIPTIDKAVETKEASKKGRPAKK